jgi:hypothetical protein
LFPVQLLFLFQPAHASLAKKWGYSFYHNLPEVRKFALSHRAGITPPESHFGTPPHWKLGTLAAPRAPILIRHQHRSRDRN